MRRYSQYSNCTYGIKSNQSCQLSGTQKGNYEGLVTYFQRLLESATVSLDLLQSHDLFRSSARITGATAVLFTH